ncbi:MAG: ferrous iron transport protein B [Desulfovibrionaceae bacterium]
MTSPKITAALAGNPNSGKTTLFNALTGARQHVGNYPGVTVEKKEGVAKIQDREIHIVDLPGAYSLTSYTPEELVARNMVLDERPDVVIDVLNAAALERNLYLAVQFMELGVPVVLVLNMMDEVRAAGMTIDKAKLSRLINAPVVETVAKHGVGKEELLRQAMELAKQQDGTWKPLNISYGPDLDHALKDMVALIQESDFLTHRYPAQWLALKYLEGDEEVLEIGRTEGTLHDKLQEIVDNVSDHCQKTLSTYPEALIADYRYGYIASILKQGVLTRDTTHDRIARSDRMDKVLTHKMGGPLIMLLILYAIYKFTFSVGDIPLVWLSEFFDFLGHSVENAMPAGMLRSMLVSGVIDGVGGVLSFAPLIMIMFLLIAFLEDSGYMARVAYMMDRVFRIFGLHGCSVMPMIVSGGIAGGCAVPGVMAARTLRSPREKLATILTAPFMTCGAKLPVYILLVGVFFPKNEPTALFAITLTAWAIALLVAKALRSTLVRGPSTPFVMELPPYRLPTAKGLIIHTWERTWQFIKKAGTVILAISILLWAAMTFPRPSSQEARDIQSSIKVQEALLSQAEGGQVRLNQEKTEQLKAQVEALHGKFDQLALQNSVAGRVGVALESISRYAGFDWRLNISLIGGFAAKEVIISTLGTAYSLSEEQTSEEATLAKRLRQNPNMTRATAVAAILFIMLYSPCFVTVVTIKQETGTWRWAAFSMIFNTALAAALAVAAYQIGATLT